MNYAHELTTLDALGEALGEALGFGQGARSAPSGSAASGTWRVARPTTQTGGFESEELVLVIEGLRPIAIAGRHVDPGSYRVRIDEARERIVLENDERTYALTAFFRPNKQGRGQGVTLAPRAADGRHLLAVRTSRKAEWVA